MTSSVLRKLEYAFSIGSSDKEACTYADIAPSTLYEFQKESPQFVERKAMLKLRPVLRARETIMKNLSQPETARWYLERKAAREFNPKFIVPDAPEEEEEFWTEEEEEMVREILTAVGVDPDDDDD